MLAYIGRRVLSLIPIVIIATIIVFTLVSLRGDPLQNLRRRPYVSQQTIQNLTKEYHLDKSKPTQYALWLRDFSKGDWGKSFQTRRAVQPTVMKALGNTALLVFGTLIFSTILALLIGVYSAVKQYSKFDYAATGFSYFGFSMPIFWFGLVLQLVLVVWLRNAFGIRLFYTQGKYSVGQEGNLFNLAQHMVLPVLALSLTGIAGWSRYQRDSMLDVLGSDYVRTAKAKGVPKRKVIWKHGARNALIPFVTVVAIDTGALFGGAVVTEKIFSWPGIGSLFLTSLTNYDYPMILAIMAVSTLFVVAFNLIADLLYGLLDPRIRLG